jgi:hypothetical protein
MAQEAVTKTFTSIILENKTLSYENKNSPPESRLNREGALGCLRHGGSGQCIHLR